MTPAQTDNGYLIVRFPSGDNPAAGATYTLDLRVVMAYIDEQMKRATEGGKPDLFAIYRVGECMLDRS